MKRVSAVAFFLSMALAAADKIPSGAFEIGPHTYSYTDASGVAWTIRETPFGVTKWRDSDVPPPPPPQPNPVSATETGDRVRFERKTPFGDYVWTRKRSELTPDEKLLFRIARDGETK